MSNQYDILLNPISFYDTLFWNIITVTEYPTMYEFEKNDPQKYNLWCKFINQKFGNDKLNEENYHIIAPLYPEFSKIISISYATVEMESNGQMNRKLKVISENTEKEIIMKFVDVLDYYHNLSITNQQKYDMVMCGYDLISFDIPHLVKKFIKYNKNNENGKKIPKLIKKYLQGKSWDQNIVNIKTAFNFNSYNYNNSFDSIINMFDIKQAPLTIEFDKLSTYYWSDQNNQTQLIEKTNANIVNSCLQFFNILRNL